MIQTIQIILIGSLIHEMKNQVGDINALESYRRFNDGVNYLAVARKATDYYPFGMIMPGRDSSAIDYRYGFQVMEQNNDFKGKGNSIGTKFRQYDPRVGRWLIFDPVKEQYPGWSNFEAFDDNPINLVDPKGSQTSRTPGHIIGTGHATFEELGNLIISFPRRIADAA